MAAYYNECDPFAAAWLRALIAEGHIAAGEVDERDIREVQPEDLEGFRQWHFFAGIGTWSYALRLAGWADDASVCTGSCPCQPFSAAGKRRGTADDRHLWPEWFRLIQDLRPAVCFGEQVSSADGLRWFDLVSADLEAAAYAVGAVDLCAASVGAPHIRQRLFFVADTNGAGQPTGSRAVRPQGGHDARRGGANGVLADTDGSASRQGGSFNGGRHPRGDALTWPRPDGDLMPGLVGDAKDERHERSAGAGRETRCGAEYTGRLDDPDLSGLARPSRQSRDDGEGCASSKRAGRAARGFWDDAEWIFCRDGKWRPVEPGTQPLAYRPPARVGRLRGYGNALVAPLAAEFIRAYLEARGDA